MFHLIAKLFWLICAPANLIVWLVLGAALLFVLAVSSGSSSLS